MLIFVIVVVLVATALAVGAAAVYRRRQLGRRVRLELANLGNVESRYRLRAEDPEDSLQFEFTLHGGHLVPQPPPEPVQAAEPRPAARPTPAQNPYEKPAGAFAAADGAMSAGGAIAGFLGTVGLLLPRSIGAPLLRASAQLRSKQMMVARVRSMPTQVNRVGRQVPRPLRRLTRKAPAKPSGKAGVTQDTGSIPGAASVPGAASAPAAGVPGWVETPPVPPGDTLVIDLLVRSSASRLRQQHPYRILSRAVDQEDAPLVTEQASVLFGGGFWTRRFVPYLAILSTGAVLLLLAFWLASVGVLA